MDHVDHVDQMDDELLSLRWQISTKTACIKHKIPRFFERSRHVILRLKIRCTRRWLPAVCRV